MSNSYRIRTVIGEDKEIKVTLDQDYEFLEILSFKIRQSDLYLRNCSDYGVLTGRVFVNGGYGVPNAKVNIFIPITDEDSQNPVISALYPYKDLQTLNEDGFRYNLLPYVPSYPGHAATGTFPSRKDVLNDSAVIEVYEKYYKYTVRTNDSGDYMIFGVPIGMQKLIMDVDLSDIGDFSQTPQDLIRMGRATKEELSGPFFKRSNDLGSLPQIVNLSKDAYVSPLWGENEVCQIGITRADFDLGLGGIEIRPSAVFMGSILSTNERRALRPRCKINKNAGNLCELVTGPGEILAIRQTIFEDNNGLPVLEQVELPEGGKLIDSDGTFMFDLPMNIDLITTNEFGEQVISDDPTVGIPTKGKYRFKFRWQQSKNVYETVKRANFLVPNIKEYGGGLFTPINNQHKRQSSYAFDLDFTGYTSGFTGQELIDRQNEIINCEDTFYEFEYNKVYTVSQLIDNFKSSPLPENMLAIKRINNPDCEGVYNTFPVNDAVYHASFSVVLANIGLTIFKFISYLILFFSHILRFIGVIISPIVFVVNLFSNLGDIRKVRLKNIIKPLKLGMITYPACTACDCDPTTEVPTGPNDVVIIPSPQTSFITRLSNNGSYTDALRRIVPGRSFDQVVELAKAISTDNDARFPVYRIKNNEIWVSDDLSLAQKINLFNHKSKYFEGKNITKVFVEPNINNNKFHTDNLVVMMVTSSEGFSAGNLLTFVDPAQSKDLNIRGGNDASFVNSNGTLNITGITNQNLPNVTLSYANPTQPSSNSSVTYNLTPKSAITTYNYVSDVEYYQVVTGLTIGQMMSLSSSTKSDSFFNEVLFSTMTLRRGSYTPPFGNIQTEETVPVTPIELFEDYKNNYIVFLQRGVDPYSPKYNTIYDLSRYFGYSSDNNIIVQGDYRLNIPTQSPNMQNKFLCVRHNNISNNNNIDNDSNIPLFFNSYFFTAGTQHLTYDTTLPRFYSKLKTDNEPDWIVSDTLSNVRIWKYKTSFFPPIFPPNQIGDYSNNPPENFDGGTAMAKIDDTQFDYFSEIYAGNLNIKMTDKSKQVMRSDRLPTTSNVIKTSAGVDLILQEDSEISMSIIEEDLLLSYSATTNIGFDPTDTNDIFGKDVLESFDCENMVDLDCYEGNGNTFGIKQSCKQNRKVINGCYIFAKVPFIDLPADFGRMTEWNFRFQFFYNLCQGVVSEIFINNWINGTLFMPTYQSRIRWNKQNKVQSRRICSSYLYYNQSSRNTFYRSSPYDGNQFIGIDSKNIALPVGAGPGGNGRNLLSPTTIVNLGPKNQLLKFTTLSNKFDGFMIDKLPPTTYGDTADLLNLFVISRITSSSWLRRLGGAISPILQLFSRPQLKIDGDYAQMASINSEYGVVKFTDEYYDSTGDPKDPIQVINGSNAKNVVMGVFYSSTTEDLQIRDFISPGRTNYRPIVGNTVFDKYNLKSQEVPFYRWRQVSSTNIFGGQLNNWSTDINQDGIFSEKYQSLDRMGLSSSDYYFKPSNSSLTNDLNIRGYIFNTKSNGEYESNYPNKPDSFLVGAPFHFYFGLKNGKTSLDRFYKEYVNININNEE